jgi:hypothetical protein
MSTSMPRGWGITSLRTWVYLGACSGPVARDFSVCAFLGSTRRSPAPQRWPNRCCLPSPTDALIDLKVRRRLGRFVPIWLNLDTLAHGRVAPVPQRRPESGDLTFEITGPTPLYRAAFGGFVVWASLLRSAAGVQFSGC